MLEYIIIKLFTKEKVQYLKYHSIISKLSLELEIQDVINLIASYYESYPEHDYISQDELLNFLQLEYQSSKKAVTLKEVILKSLALDVSDSLASDTVRMLIEKDYVNKMVNEAMPVLSGEASGVMAELRSLLNEFDLVCGEDTEEDSPFIERSLDDLLEQMEEDGLEWRLQCFNEGLGPLTGGTLGHAYARPETGKTTLLHSEVTHMIQQLNDDECILWINNEEDHDRILRRFYCAVCNMTLSEIMANRDKAKQVFAANGGHRMKLHDNASVSVEGVEQLAKKCKPRLIVVDQGDKLTYRGMDKAGNEASKLKGIYDSLREVVKRCNKEWTCDMLTIGQAAVTAEGKKWLTQGDIDSGKTGKPGAFDYMIGIGKTLDPREEGMRFITFPKNKLQADAGRYVVNFDKYRGRYIDMA